MMSTPPASIITAGLRPELFNEPPTGFMSRTFLVAVLIILVLAGFGLRAYQLSAEGLSEDELNKLNAVADYRANGLTGANGEHPFLMKALQTASIVAAESWNKTAFVRSHSTELQIPVEAALRLPSAIFGALTAVLIYLVAAELFGIEVALIAAALWTCDPNAIGFNRIAKEDTFFLFFFLLANFFWLRSQTIAESNSGQNPEPYYRATGAAFGAMLASKYVPHLIAVSVCYNYIFQGLPTRRWRIGRPRYAVIFAVMGVVFLICNPTILLPSTWREMLAFASIKKIGHDSYEFMGALYPHKPTAWLKGVPWYFYFVFMWVKLPLLTLATFLIGLPLLFRRRIGDGRYFLLFWAFCWGMAFIPVGGKFTRYFTLVLPAVLIISGLGVQFTGHLIARWCEMLFNAGKAKGYARVATASLVILISISASVTSVPHYRLYTNALGGGMAHAGDYFPHDEFYDAGLRQAIFEIAQRARHGAQVASEVPTLAAFYAQQAGRPDLVFISSSDHNSLRMLGAGDFVIAARGRRYLSNDALLSGLRNSSVPAFRVSLGGVPAVDVYALNQST